MDSKIGKFIDAINKSIRDEISLNFDSKSNKLFTNKNKVEQIYLTGITKTIKTNFCFDQVNQKSNNKNNFGSSSSIEIGKRVDEELTLYCNKNIPKLLKNTLLINTEEIERAVELNSDTIIEYIKELRGISNVNNRYKDTNNIIKYVIFCIYNKIVKLKTQKDLINSIIEKQDKQSQQISNIKNRIKIFMKGENTIKYHKFTRQIIEYIETNNYMIIDTQTCVYDDEKKFIIGYLDLLVWNTNTNNLSVVEIKTGHDKNYKTNIPRTQIKNHEKISEYTHTNPEQPHPNKKKKLIENEKFVKCMEFPFDNTLNSLYNQHQLQLGFGKYLFCNKYQAKTEESFILLSNNKQKLVDRFDLSNPIKKKIDQYFNSK